MPAGALLASLVETIRSSGRWHLAAFGRPLAVVVVLIIGASVFTSAATLLGHRHPAVIFYAAAEGGSFDGLAEALNAMPLHAPSALHETELDTTLAVLKAGSFGVAFDRQAIDALAAGPVAPAMAAPPFRPTVMVDAALPPLRVDIMGFDGAPRANRAPGAARDLARAAEP
jgi:hypothetical protein